MTDRRLLVLTMLLALAAPSAVLAKDGDSGGNSGSDDGGGDRDDSGGKSRNRRGRDNDGDDEEEDRRDDRDRIRKAVREGRARPLRYILDLVRARYKGQVVRVRLAGHSSSLVYRIRMIDTKNALIEVDVEAATGRVIRAAGL